MAKKVAVVFGTRPEGIKLAPVIKQLQTNDYWEPRVVVTGQHREMLDQVLELFEITPDYNFHIMRDNQTLTGITYRVLRGLEEVFAEWVPDCLIVHGDPTSAVAAALAGFYYRIPVVHVEAGLRTGTINNPFPEEANRRLIDVVTSLFLAPTEYAKMNLLREGVAAEKIFVTGNTVIDALHSVVNPAYEFKNPQLRAINFHKPTILVTVHRRENWGQPLQDICGALAEISETHPVEIVFAMHKNPRVQKVVLENLDKLPRVHLIDGPNYLEFVNLMSRVSLVVTDSGGLQEEAPALNKPVLVLREVTERPEGLEAGTLRLIGTNKEDIVREVTNLITDRQLYDKMAQAQNPYGDGQASLRIERILIDMLEQWGDTDGNST